MLNRLAAATGTVKYQEEPPQDSHRRDMASLGSARQCCTFAVDFSHDRQRSAHVLLVARARIDARCKALWREMGFLGLAFAAPLRGPGLAPEWR